MEKKWYLSKSVWASLIVVAISAIRLFWPEGAEQIEAEQEGIAEWLVNAATLIGGALAFIWRLTAKKTITKKLI